MKLLTKYSIVLIFALAFLIRSVNLSQEVPPSINWDEASLGYNAYSILKTSKDEWGRVFPLTFEAFGDYKLPGYVYTLVPFVALLGLNEFAVRFPSVIFGSLSIVFLYLIVLELTKDKQSLPPSELKQSLPPSELKQSLRSDDLKKWALLSALLLTFSPWHFFLSRIALEANLAFSFFLTGLYCLVVGFRKKLFLLPASLLFGLSIFTYNSARIFVPLFLLTVIFSYWKQIKITKISIISAITFGIFLSLGFYLAVFQDSSARYYWVRILDEGAVSFLDQARNNSNLPDLLTKLIYNRPVYFVFNFFVNYLKHLSIQFLAISGGTNYQFSLQNMGLIYLAEVPFLIFGFFKLLKSKIGRMFLLWFLIAPIPSALTREAPHALRSIFMLGSIQIITALGMIQAFKLLDKKKLLQKSALALTCLLIMINSVAYFKAYFSEYPKKYSQAWQYGYKQAIDEVRSNYDKYPRIYFTKHYGEAHIFYLFFSKYEPLRYQTNENLIRYAQTNWRWVDRLDKIYFLNDWELVDKLKDEKNALVITSPGSVPENSKKIETLYFLDGSKAFEIVEI